MRQICYHSPPATQVHIVGCSAKLGMTVLWRPLGATGSWALPLGQVYKILENFEADFLTFFWMKLGGEDVFPPDS